MSRKIAPLAPEGVPEALSLVVASYESEKRRNPLLPPKLLGNPDNALPYIEGCIGNGCVASYDGGKMIGFMGIHAFFTFKGQRAALVRSIHHAAREKRLRTRIDPSTRRWARSWRKSRYGCTSSSTWPETRN